MENTLFYGDNLTVLREHIAPASVDLVYLDPPFNSNRNYNVLFKDEHGKEADAQITAFEDTWHWNLAAEQTYAELVEQTGGAVGNMIGAMRQFIGANQMMAYLVMMAARLVELHRVLKPTGSLYLHCDPTASHYLKMLLDTIFGPKNFRNEIIWKRSFAHGDAKNFGNLTDSILYYAKSQNFIWNKQYEGHNEEYISRFSHQDPDGRRWMDTSLSAKGLSGGGYEYEYKGIKGFWRCPIDTMRRLEVEGKLHFTKSGGIRLKRYLDENKGLPLQSLWIDIPPINSQAAERLGYPTQKPLALLERIIKASSKEGDVVLDPFCGCGTAIIAAQKLNRKWLGIDITHLAIALMRSRLKDSFQLERVRVVGEPTSVQGAAQLAADDKYQFQWWALSLIEARPYGGQEGSREGKKGADSGIDGVISFIDDPSGKPKRIIVQVKGGHVARNQVEQLRGTIEREKAAMGVYISLEPPTRPMQEEATSAGFYHSPNWDRNYPRIQLLTIEQLLHGATVQMPPTKSTFKRSQSIAEAEQMTFP